MSIIRLDADERRLVIGTEPAPSALLGSPRA
jgi:hypothetical protein